MYAAPYYRLKAGENPSNGSPRLLPVKQHGCRRVFGRGAARTDEAGSCTEDPLLPPFGKARRLFAAEHPRPASQEQIPGNRQPADKPSGEAHPVIGSPEKADAFMEAAVCCVPFHPLFCRAAGKILWQILPLD